MTTPSSFQGLGITVNVYRPFIQGGQFVMNMSEMINGYNHTIATDGGHVSATITVSGDKNFMEDWLQSGLGRHIQVYGPSYQLIWEGYVNQIDVAMGSLTATRGPLNAIVNRVSTMYTPIIDDDVDPVVTGATTETVITENDLSQGEYGIWEKVLSIGTVLDSEAEDIQAIYLLESAYPEGNISISVGNQSSDMTATIQCRGYIDWMNFVYNNPVTPLSMWASDKVEDVLAADPNAIIVTNYDEVGYNAVLVPSWEDTNRTAKTIIDEIVQLGDGTDGRWAFALFGRIPRYYAVGTEVEYFYYISDNVQYVETRYGEKVAPWDVQPAKWAAIPDFYWGSATRSLGPRNDPRTFFIEQVDFTAPNLVVLTGKKVNKLPQFMAKMGLGSI